MRLKRKNIAVILAGGIGSRMGADVPKQFLNIDDKSILEMSVHAFSEHEYIYETILVIHPGFIDYVKEMKSAGKLPEDLIIIKGGKSRTESAGNAVKYFADYKEIKNLNLLFHDAARPFVSERIINDTVLALEKHSAVGVAVKSTDTIWIADDGFIKSIPERENMYNAQTPQAFRYSIIYKAYMAAANRKFCSTDDCGLVLKFFPDEKIYIVNGENENRKVTHPDDIL